MKLYIPVVAPNFLRALERVSPLRGISAITIAPLIISKEPLDPEIERHEGTHAIQQYECGLVMVLGAMALLVALHVPWWVFVLTFLWSFAPFIGGFYLLYGIMWLYWRIRARQAPYPGLTAGEMAYLLVAFEREAHVAETYARYLTRRRPFAWVHVSRLEDTLLKRTASRKVYDWVKASRSA